MNRSRTASAYLADDDGQWNRLATFRKDFWHAGLFQFGTIVLPYSCYDGPLGMFSGQALANADNTVFVLDLKGFGRSSSIVSTTP